MGASSSSQDDFVSEINVTPFVDVMLVLLIIFMVTAPMMTEGLDVNLPKVATSETMATDDDHIVITIKDDGTVFLDEFGVGLAELDTTLRTRVTQAGRQVFLKADTAAQYGTVMRVLDILRQNGIRDIGMVTVPATTAQTRPAK